MSTIDDGHHGVRDVGQEGAEAHHNTPASMHYLTEEEKLARADEITAIAF